MTDQQSGMDRDLDMEHEQGTDDLGGGREYGGTGTDYGSGEGGAGDVAGQTDIGSDQRDLGDWQRDREKEQGGNL